MAITPAANKRKPRGTAIEETALMKALENPDTAAAAMEALADEAQNDWEKYAALRDKGMIAAKDSNGA